MAGDTKYYFDYHFPLNIVKFILGLIFGTPGAVTPIDTAEREWFSQPRPGNDTTTEVISTLFKLPLSVSEITMDVLRVPCEVEIWYQDRSNNWRQVMDMQRVPLRFLVSGSESKSWYKFHARVYPIVALQMQFRITRSPDPNLINVPYVCGIRNTLIRRNVYERSQGTQYFEEEIDIMGNVINKYIKDWDASRAFDDDPHTFWKSMPMPDPNAVCSMYLDVRAEDGTPNLIDKLYLDPMYSGQMMNLYYSSDDTVGVRKLSPITVYPYEDENTSWRVGPNGRVDSAPSLEESYYRWPLAIGPLPRKDSWIGVEWSPDFTHLTGPPENPVLLRVMTHAMIQGRIDITKDDLDATTDPDEIASLTAELSRLTDTLNHTPADSPDTWRPALYYDVGANGFVLRFDNGTEEVHFYAPLSRTFDKGQPLRIVAGWSYGPDTIHITVQDRRGNTVAFLEEAGVTGLPDLVSFDGQVEMWNFRGAMTAHIIKVDNHWQSSAGFIANPTFYCNPDPVIPDASGNIPATTLDRAVYAAAWIAQEHGTGGSSETHFEDKEWTPIWRDYVTQKGMIFFPQALSMKYLKMEFTNLNEEPYPVYESGVETRYKVFPTSVIQESTLGPRLYTGEGGPLGLGTFISRNGVKSVNWLSPTSVQQAIGMVFAPDTPPVIVNQGNPYITEAIPNQDNGKASEEYRVEMSSGYVYRREALDPYILAQDQYNTIIKAEGLGVISDFTDVPWGEIEAANPGAVQRINNSAGAIPLRGSDWWIFPGQQLRIPASIMEKLTDSSTVTERKLTLEHRVRFNTTAIHRYDYRTLKRDAAIAYFAGIREVMPFTSTFNQGEDKPVFEFDRYDTSQGWVPVNVEQRLDGTVTAVGNTYHLLNFSFDNGLNYWIPGPEDHTWIQDKRTGHWAWGSANVTANGTEQEMLSVRVSVEPGEVIDFSAWIKYSGLTITGGEDGIILGAVGYLDGEEVGRYVVSKITGPTSSAAPFTEISNLWTVPDGVDTIRVRLAVTEEATAGSVWFDLITLEDATFEWGTLYNQFTTQSDFSKVLVNFRDSGLIRSDSMWAQAVPRSDGVNAVQTITIDRTIDGDPWTLTHGGLTTIPLSYDPTAAEIQTALENLETIHAGSVEVTGGGLTEKPFTVTFMDELGRKPLPTMQVTMTGEGSVVVKTTVSGETPVSGTNTDSVDLAPYVEPIPSIVPTGLWKDSIKTWGTSFKDEDGDFIAPEVSTEWGTPFSVVSVTIDGNRRYQGNRVLHVIKEQGTGQAGLQMRQYTNYVPHGLFRIGFVAYKPFKNANKIHLRFRRISDHTPIHDELVDVPTGRWYEYKTRFIEIPDIPDQEYELLFTMEGADGDEIYISDLFTEVARIRYYMTLGGEGSLPVEVTDLRYESGYAQLVATESVTQMSVTVAILSSEVFAYGCRLQPAYLR